MKVKKNKGKGGGPKVVKPKTRKELRKEKRQLKKVNKKEYFERNKQKKEDNKKPGKSGQKKPVKDGKSGKKTLPQKPRIIHEDELLVEEDDEEIHSSEFESGDDDAEEKPKKVTLVDDPIIDRFKKDIVKEKREQRKLSASVRKRRIKQLKEENEKEDQLIKKLGKKLKIDPTRADKTVPKCFDDGFDYILEMCLPENIDKMYQAAKEAADTADFNDDFEDDLNEATGNETKLKKNTDLISGKKKASELRKIEHKYLDMESEDEDSEFQESEDSDDNVQELPTKSIKNRKLVKKKEKVVEEPIQDEEDYDDDSMDGIEEEESDNSEFENDESENSELEENDENLFKNDSDNEPGEEIEEDDNQSFDQSDSEKKSGDPSTWEDIYGRKRDKEGRVLEAKSEKYVPPHLRAKAETEVDTKRAEKLQRLRRQLKGSLNRLAEQNLHKITNDIEQMYMQNTRHDMNETVTKLITEALISPSLSPERMVLEHCLLIAILHANVGTEVGAHFLHDLVKRFDNLIKNISTLHVENKELDNIVLILCHLYTFRLYDKKLLYEFLGKLTLYLGEKSIECVLLVLRSVGFVLRKDDPLALKEFIGDIQKKAGEAPEELKENTRLKFLLDILMAVKNNNMNKIPNYDQTVAEHLRKVLKTVLGPGKYVSTLNIPMNDLLASDEKGKWWVVGSAWTGKDESKSDSNCKSLSNSDSFSQKLLDLARKQRMNTEDRKNVFCIIMSAEDYLDAFEKLLHLGIKDQKVIVSVLMHCCLAEKTYNPYYSTLAQKFCEFDRKYQLGFQYSSWDKIKEIEGLNQTQISNFARFLAHLILEGGQPLSVLKIVEFGSLNKYTMKFVRQILLAILMKDDTSCRKVFMRIAPSNNLANFKDSIKLFLHHFLQKGAIKSGLPANQLNTLKQRILLADQSIDMTDSRVQF